MAKILGIDLGTTNSAVAIVEGGEPRIIENAEGNRTTPSVVAVAKNGDRSVGQVAKRQAVTNPQNTIYGIKRFMGHKLSDKEVQKIKDSVPFSVSAGDGNAVRVKLGDKDYSPEEISAMILRKLKEDAEKKLGEEVTEAVITVPAYFNDNQRKATKDAGEIAGLKVRRIINEPTAAALAYGFNKKKDEKIVVYDFGGGTFDVSVLEVGDDVVEVKSTDGDSAMGGRDIDQKIIEWLAAEFKKDSGIDITTDPLALQRLDEAAEKAKHELSTTTETEVNIPFITSDSAGPKHLLIKMNRSKLEELAEEYVKSSIEITERAVKESGFALSDINEIVLVGGQTRMPAIFEAVKKLFGKEPNTSINPDEVVADGAAIQAGILQGDVKDVLLLDVTPLSLSIETMGGVATKLIERNTTIPTSKSQVFSTAADNQTSVQIRIAQGERTMFNDNRLLGEFILDSIPPAPRGTPQIEVSFDVDANGILNVKAVDKATNKEQSIKIEASSSLSDDDIEKMKKDAEMHAGEDEKKKELIDVRNTTDQLVYTAEKALKDNGDKIGGDIKQAIEDKIKQAKETKEKDDVEAIKNVNEELSTEMQKIGEAMAEQAQAQGGEAGADGDAKVKDVEVEEEGDKDNEEGKEENSETEDK